MDPIAPEPLSRHQKRIRRWAMPVLVAALGVQQFFGGGSRGCCPMMNHCQSMESEPTTDWALESLPLIPTDDPATLPSSLLP